MEFWFIYCWLVEVLVYSIFLPCMLRFSRWVTAWQTLDWGTSVEVVQWLMCWVVLHSTSLMWVEWLMVYGWLTAERLQVWLMSCSAAILHFCKVHESFCHGDHLLRVMVQVLSVSVTCACATQALVSSLLHVLTDDTKFQSYVLLIFNMRQILLLKSYISF